MTATPGYDLEVPGQIVSGSGSIATGSLSSLGGGSTNSATGDRATTGGGIDNATACRAFVGAGEANSVYGSSGTVTGGRDNDALADHATVGGGDSNAATGFSAEEVGAVIPEVVTWEENGVDASSVDSARLTAVLVEAVNELEARLAALEAATG